MTPARSSAHRRALPLCAALLLSACVVVPQTREVYDPRCKVLTKEVVLETAVLGQFGACHGRECQALLATLGLVTAATAVVSGSVAVVGNVVYWFERQGRCPGSHGQDAALAPASAVVVPDPGAHPPTRAASSAL